MDNQRSTASLHRPTREELLAAAGKTVPDVIALDLKILFCGINPGLYTAAIGHHFGRPGNRFWPALFGSGFTPRLFFPYEERELLPLRYGITNVVARATATADELTRDEYVQGGHILKNKVLNISPHTLAILGVGAYRTAFDRPKAAVGLQEEKIGSTLVWVLPNPSGLNAHYQMDSIIAAFHTLKESIR